LKEVISVKHLKIAFSPKALEVFGPIEGREAVEMACTDFTDASALVITDIDEDIEALNKAEAVDAFGVPVFVVSTNGQVIPDALEGKVRGVLSLDSSKHNAYEFQVLKAANAYEDTLMPPFFKALEGYADSCRNSWTTPGHHIGESYLQHPAGRVFYDFFGPNVFRADCSCSDAAMGDLLLHDGAPGEAEAHAARVFNCDRAYFVLNGTSTSNKIVLNAVLAPGDIVLYDRNGHKSISQGALVQAGAIPVYLEDARNAFGSIGGIKAHCFEEDYIRKLIAEKDPVKAKAKRPVRLCCIQLGTYDGCIYNAREVIKKIGHLCDYILFDSAWVGYEQFIPMMRDCSPLLIDNLGPEDPGIFVTHSVHKLQSGFSQASQILKKDSHIMGQERYVDHKRLNNAFMLHESTSPLYQIFASIDVNARMLEGKAGKYMWRKVMRAGIELRKAILRNCHYFHPMVPETVHGKPWIEGDTEKMIDDKAYWEMTPGAKWHGFEGYSEGQFLMDPCHLQLMTPGIDMKTGEYTKFGIHGSIISKFLQRNNLVPEKNDLNAILFMLTPGTDMAKASDLVAKLVEFERLVDEDALMADVLPEIYEANEETYKGFTLKQLCQKMQDFYASRKVNVLQQRLFLRDYLPPFFMTPQEANFELVRGHCELVKLKDAEGRVALEGALPYPPGILTMQPGERWNENNIKYFLALEEGINKLPGFAPEIQGVYFEDVDGYTTAFAYVLTKEAEENFEKNKAARKDLLAKEAR
jgi:ornithine decarboxylase